MFRSTELTPISEFLKSRAGAVALFPASGDHELNRLSRAIRESEVIYRAKVKQSTVMLITPGSTVLYQFRQVEILKTATKRKKLKQGPKGPKRHKAPGTRALRARRFTRQQQADAVLAEFVRKALSGYETSRKTGVTALDLLAPSESVSQAFDEKNLPVLSESLEPPKKRGRKKRVDVDTVQPFHDESVSSECGNFFDTDEVTEEKQPVEGTKSERKGGEHAERP